MRQAASPTKRTRPFVRLRTIRSMKEVAKQMVAIKKAAHHVNKVKVANLDGADDSMVIDTMVQVAMGARAVASAADVAIGIVDELEKKVRTYRKTL